MTTNHTPGPWTIERDPEGMIILGPIAHAPGVIASEYVARPHGINGRKEANARLIAAAPDMLEALRSLVQFESGGDSPLNPNQRKALWDEARAVIAKATGAA